jgi:hypothetical protein
MNEFKIKITDDQLDTAMKESVRKKLQVKADKIANQAFDQIEKEMNRKLKALATKEFKKRLPKMMQSFIKGVHIDWYG